tara:strand:+ start:425 stop:811 length:387 start_codon:yes stop_codon:yes gene_type:complete
MSKPKLTWQFYAARRRGLTVEKYIDVNKIKTLEELQESLRQKDVQLPDHDLLKDLFKPAWTGKYSTSAEKAQEAKPQSKKASPNAKPNKTTSRKKRGKSAAPEKKSTYLQAAYETGSQDEDPDADPGA